MMLGGHCQLDVIIPYAMSINMGIQLLLYTYYLFEHCYKSYDIDMKALDEVDPKVKQDLVMFEEMMSLFIKWLYVNAAFLIIMLWLDRYRVTQGSWLFCSYDQTSLIYVESKGAHYITIFCLQLLLVANSVKVVLYEGGMRTKAFGESTPESTYCM